MPLSAIISEAQALTRESLSIPSATYLAWLNRINRGYARKGNWPFLRVPNATLTTVANQAGYDLPSSFSRIMGKFVFWNPTATTGGYTGGSSVPFHNQGNEVDDSQILAWTNQGNGGQLIPQVAYVEPKSGTPTTLQLVIAPFPSVAGTIILYNYYKEPTAFTSVSDEIPVPTLYDTYVMALCKEQMRYLGNADGFGMYGQSEKTEYRDATAVRLSQ